MDKIKQEAKPRNPNSCLNFFIFLPTTSKVLANHFTLDWGLDKVPVKTRDAPNLKSSIVDYQNQKEEKYSKKKVFEQKEKDHQIFFDYDIKLSDPVKLPKISTRLPPGFEDLR